MLSKQLGGAPERVAARERSHKRLVENAIRD